MPRKIVDAALLIVVVFAAAFLYLYHAEVVMFTRNLIYGAPCTRAITYSLGEIDPRFKLSEEEILSIINKAAGAWDKASSKNLLDYTKTDGTVIVNFKYDRRQQVTEELIAIDATLDAQSAVYKSLKQEYDSLMIKHEANKKAFETHKEAASAKQKAYNEKVDSWNRRGGAPPAVVAELNAERDAINTEYVKLNAEVDTLNKEVRDLNALAQKLNASVKTYNNSVNTFNQTNASTPAEFREGEYISDGRNQEINIYQFSDDNKLLRVLEHEFGHAIGLEHVNDKSAIMYELNVGTSEIPNASDITELQAVCSKKY